MILMRSFNNLILKNKTEYKKQSEIWTFWKHDLYLLVDKSFLNELKF